MNIIVCMKQVPDTTEVTLGGDMTLQRDFVAQVTNPADESALEKALTLRGQDGCVTALTMGPKRAETMLREALSRGADKAVQLTDPAFAGADTLATAKTLCAGIRALGGAHLILCGRRAVDGETGQVGGMLAALLDIPCVQNALDIIADGQSARVTQLTESGERVITCALPCVVTMCEWSHRLRLPTMKGLRSAGRADIPVLHPGDLGIAREDCGLRGSPTRVKNVSARPVGARPCKMMTVKELFEVLT